MARRIRIGDKWVGDQERCFIIAEAGSNHNGDLQQAKNMIDVAADSEADAVKFQLFRADKLYPNTEAQSDYLQLDRSIYDIIREMEIPYEWIPELASHCQDKNIVFLSSAFDEESVDQLDPYVPAYKIASYEMNHLPLVRHIAGKGKPVIISTGTASLDEVRETVDAFFETGNHALMLMQCTAAYPAPLESLNLQAISTMQDAFQVPVGFSDHSRAPLIGPMAAVALGADLVEKHFTLGNKLPGPDHAFSLEPDELRSMVLMLREVESALGTGEKITQPVEAELRKFARRSIFAIRKIFKGETFTPKNVAVLRCGNLNPGLEPKFYDMVLGKNAVHDIQTNSAIVKSDYA